MTVLKCHIVMKINFSPNRTAQTGSPLKLERQAWPEFFNEREENGTENMEASLLLFIECLCLNFVFGM